MAKKQTELSDTRSEDIKQTKALSDRAPVWDGTENRVKIAIWKHPAKDNSWRFTTAIFRSYVDKVDGTWHNVHYYDKKDLKDVIQAAQTAMQQIDRLEGLNAL